MSPSVKNSFENIFVLIVIVFNIWFICKLFCVAVIFLQCNARLPSYKKWFLQLYCITDGTKARLKVYFSWTDIFLKCCFLILYQLNSSGFYTPVLFHKFEPLYFASVALTVVSSCDCRLFLLVCLLAVLCGAGYLII